MEWTFHCHFSWYIDHLNQKEVIMKGGQRYFPMLQLWVPHVRAEGSMVGEAKGWRWKGKTLGHRLGSRNTTQTLFFSLRAVAAVTEVWESPVSPEDSGGPHLSWCCWGDSWWATRWLQGGSWPCQKCQPCNLRLELWATWCQPKFLTSEERREAEDRIQTTGWWYSQLWLHNEIPIETMDSEAQMVGECINVPGYILILYREDMEKTQELCIWDPPRSYPMDVLWLVQIFILSKCIRRELSWGLWVVLLNYQIWEGHENPKTSSQLFRGGLGTLEHGAGIGRERSLRRTVSSPYGVCGNPGWLMSELHWSIFLNDWVNLLQSSEAGKSKQPPIFPEEAKWLSYPLSLWVKW